MSKYYYFKLGSSNFIFKQMLEQYKLANGNIDFSKMKSESKLPIAIYYDYGGNRNWISSTTTTEIESKFSKQSTVKKNILTFKNEVLKGSIIWITCDLHTYCFECVDDKLFEVHKGTYDFLWEDYKKKTKWTSLPKAKYFKLKHVWPHDQVPQFFASINSNQRYNRSTIKELNNSELDVARAMIDSISGNPGSITIDSSNFYKYISPSQFETLIHHIYLFKGGIPESYKGVAREHIDLTVYDVDGLSRLDIQIKQYDVGQKEAQKLVSLPNVKNFKLIHTGQYSSSEVFGIDWIMDQIQHFNSAKGNIRPVNEWLSKQFSYDIFNFQMNKKHSLKEAS